MTAYMELAKHHITKISVNTLTSSGNSSLTSASMRDVLPTPSTTQTDTHSLAYYYKTQQRSQNDHDIKLPISLQ